LELQPNDPDAQVVLGNAYMAKNDVPRAIIEYERALSLHPEDSNAHYNLAVALTEKGESDRAAREFEKAREFGSHGQH